MRAAKANIWFCSGIRQNSGSVPRSGERGYNTANKSLLGKLEALKVTTNSETDMKNPEPQKEHQWLQRMLGEWTSEMQASMGPDKPDEKCEGTESVRSVGQLWIMGEGAAKSRRRPRATYMTLGTIRRKKKVGTFIGSMMTLLGLRRHAGCGGKVLTLDTVGPSYRSGEDEQIPGHHRTKSDDHRILNSRVLVMTTSERP